MACLVSINTNLVERIHKRNTNKPDMPKDGQPRPRCREIHTITLIILVFVICYTLISIKLIKLKIVIPNKKVAGVSVCMRQGCMRVCVCARMTEHRAQSVLLSPGVCSAVPLKA